MGARLPHALEECVVQSAQHTRSKVATNLHIKELAFVEPFFLPLESLRHTFCIQPPLEIRQARERFYRNFF